MRVRGDELPLKWQQVDAHTGAAMITDMSIENLVGKSASKSPEDLFFSCLLFVCSASSPIPTMH